MESTTFQKSLEKSGFSGPLLLKPKQLKAKYEQHVKKSRCSAIFKYNQSFARYKKSLLLARFEILNYTEVYLGSINNMIKERSNLLYVLSLQFLRD